MHRVDSAVRRSSRVVAGPVVAGAHPAVVLAIEPRAPICVAAADQANPAVSPDRLESDDECNDLLLQCAAADRYAFERLYQLTSAKLFAAVRRTIWTRSEAEEVLQETYLKIWNGASSFDPNQAQATTWMLRVARNHAIDHLRRGAARRTHEFNSVHGDNNDADSSAAIGGNRVDDAPRPDEWLEIDQDKQRFDRLMDSLGGKQRQVLLLAFREGYTQADIALRLDAPLGSVKSWIRRALQKLKTTIDADQARQNTRND